MPATPIVAVLSPYLLAGPGGKAGKCARAGWAQLARPRPSTTSAPCLLTPHARPGLAPDRTSESSSHPTSQPVASVDNLRDAAPKGLSHLPRLHLGPLVSGPSTCAILSLPWPILSLGGIS